MLKNNKQEFLSKYEQEETIRCFEYVLSGKQASYPTAFFSGSKGELKLKLILEHYFFTINNYTREEASSKVCGRLLEDLKLIHAVRTVYGSRRAHNVFTALFPEMEIWKLNPIRNELWTDEVKKDFCVWFLEEYNNLSKEKIFGGSFSVNQVSIGENDNSIEGLAVNRVFGKFTGICHIIATAYDMNKDEVKYILLGRDY